MPRELTSEETAKIVNRNREAGARPIAPIPAPVGPSEGTVAEALADLKEHLEGMGATVVLPEGAARVSGEDWQGALDRADDEEGESVPVGRDLGGEVPVVGGRMRASVKGKDLRRWLAGLRPATSGSLPVLGCVRLSVRGGALLAEVTSLDLHGRALMMVDDGEEGMVVVPLKKLAALLKADDSDEDGMVWMGADAAGNLEVRCGEWEAKLLGMDPAEFPRVPEMGELMCEAVGTTGVLGRMLELAVVAVSKDAGRYVLTGVHIEGKPGGLRMEGTDGRRLVRVDVRGFTEAFGMDVVMPSAAVRMVLGLMGGAEDEVRVLVMKAWLVWGGGGWWMASKRIDGKYPETDRVMPEVDGGEEVTLIREGVVEMVERAGVLAGEADHHAVTVRIAAGRCSVRASAADVGEWCEELALWSGPVKSHGVLEFRACADYLAALSGPEAEEVTLRMAPGGKGGMLWSCKEARGVSWKYVLMPLAAEKS